MSKKQKKIKNFILKYRFIIISFIIIAILIYLNNSVWRPMISKEKLQIKEQQKNSDLIRQREESKLKLTSSGAYFLPSGDKSINKGINKGKKKGTTTKNSNNKVSTPVKQASIEIAKKIEYMHKRIIKVEKDTEEVDYNHKANSPFAPINEKSGINNISKARYIPKYNLTKLEYKGFYSKSGKKTAIVRYDGQMNYVSLGDQIENTVLIVNSIERAYIELKDNKTGDIHSIEK
ncbi:MAG: hypothetical protein C0601_08305 [Candidatus Muiribacterium halophilum]|uniref:Uncharacterized protein n=1 Tax=Muiribacterium halophilum TaxID=2053465 RepID=A0A2N5ZEM2_MUIH1|nr:MAG: hypothetical protein C0601_08305 [Candidatus Muirbacterium halophilum]